MEDYIFYAIVAAFMVITIVGTLVFIDWAEKIELLALKIGALPLYIWIFYSMIHDVIDNFEHHRYIFAILGAFSLIIMLEGYIIVCFADHQKLKVKLKKWFHKFERNK